MPGFLKRSLKKGKLPVLPLVMTIFFCVSGGPYGLEQVMQTGAGMGLLLILVTPLIWALPAALMTAELSTAIPAEGGYYVWVKRAMGPAAGFFCAWLTYMYSWVDVAMYPVLFISYLKSFAFADILQSPVNSFIVSLSMIIPLTWLNIRGTRAVGNSSVVFSLLLLLPFAIMVVMGMGKVFSHPTTVMHPFVPAGQSTFAAFSSGLYIVMWNYLGWDSISTIAGEIQEPQKLFPRALLIGLPLIILCYFLPALVGIAAQPDTSQWGEGSWPSIAGLIGGPVLAAGIGLCGLLSAAGLFSAGLQSSSRIPFVLAKDKILPPFFTRLHPRFDTPWIAILFSAGIYTALSLLDFKQLAEIDVILYSSALLLEFIALLILRIKEPHLTRPFKIPGGWFVLILVVFLPIAVILFAFYNLFHEGALLTFWMLSAAVLTGIVVWRLSKKARLSASEDAL
jgi:amino acid transporter